MVGFSLQAKPTVLMRLWESGFRGKQYQLSVDVTQNKRFFSHAGLLEALGKQKTSCTPSDN